MAPDPKLDEIYTALLPRFRAARRRYVRQRLAVVLALPCLVVVGIAWADEQEPAEVSQLAGVPEAQPTPDTHERDATHAQRERDTTDAQRQRDAAERERDTGERDSRADRERDGDRVAWRWVELGFAGRIQVALVDAGLVAGELELRPGWRGEVLSVGPADRISVVLVHGDLRLVAHIGLGDEGDLVVHIDDITPEPTPEPTPDPTPEPTPAPEPTPTPTPEPEPDRERDRQRDRERERDRDREREIETRREIHVGEVATVVVERDGDQLWLGVLWTHEWWEPVMVVSHGEVVHAYFTNDGVEIHVQAWIEGRRIVSESWVVEPERRPYDGRVSCGFGDVGIVVEGNVAHVMSLEEVEGVEAVVDVEVGETVRVRFITAEETWLMEAWGDGERVVAECVRLE